ncbi:MAG TPA: TraR/DksA C4-type zinc finger protein [Acidimicrobiales bacterium]|nr:TraR/DksA C4-type zinc finger protein [Acidimicrobiales bacterium]
MTRAGKEDMMTPAGKPAASKKASGASSSAAKKTGSASKATTAKKTVPARTATPARTAAPARRSSAPAPKKATAPPKRGVATKAVAKKVVAPAKKAAPAPAAKKAQTEKAGAKKASAPAPAKKASAPSAPAPAPKKAEAAAPPKAKFVPKPKPPAPVRPKTGPYAKDDKFLEEIRGLLLEERAIYQEQATSLRAEADSLALEREPGDVQFDEESGEGGTVTVDRERNLALSGQASAAVEEIDDALGRVADKTYGYCERCFQPIPKPRLRALPYARLCVACKSGGLSRR